MKSDVDHLWDFDDPAGSERRFVAALEATPAGKPGRRAEILSQLARALGLQRRFEEGEEAIVRARALGSSARVRVRVELEAGRIRRTSGDAAGARPHFERAWQEAQGVDDWLAVDAAHMLAIVSKGEESIAWNRRAIELAAASADPDARAWRASLLNNLGWSLHDLGRFEEALAALEEALVERRARCQEAETLVARWACARCLRSLGRTEDALAMQRALARDHEQRGGGDGYVDEEIGECLLALGRRDEARAHFAAAYQRLKLDPWLARDEPQRLERMRSLAGPAAG